jgi:hypothetical protein
MNSSVISAKNTQIFKALRRRFSSTNASFSHLQNCRLTRLPLGLSCVDVKSVDGQRRPGVSIFFPVSSPRRSSCHRSSWIVCSVWKEPLWMMTPAFLSSRQLLLVIPIPGWPPYRFSADSLSWGDRRSHTASIEIAHSCGARLLAAAFSWLLVTSCSLAGVPADSCAASSFRTYLRASLSNLSPPMRRCCLTSRCLTPSTNAWAASVRMNSIGRLTKAQIANWSTAAADSYSDSPISCILALNFAL